MRLIISAFRKDVHPWRQTQDTADLIMYVGAMNRALRTAQPGACLKCQLVIGTWQGTREISVEITGWLNEGHLSDTAMHMLDKFGQTSVLVEFNGAAYLLSHKGTEYLGEAAVSLSPGVFKKDGTEYLDGRVFEVLPKVAHIKQAA